MAEIGSTLREARMRRKIDISAVEAATKIRAKYLRALEAEEFDSLPGPAYVKSFIRTYSTYLGLDPNLLVDRYRSQHEKREERWLVPIASPPKGRERSRQKRPLTPVTLVAIVLAGIVAIFLVLGLTDSSKDVSSDRSTKPTDTHTTVKKSKTTDKTSTTGKKNTTAGNGTKKDTAKLTVVAKQNVWICLESNKGKRLIASETLSAGQSRGPFKERAYKVTLGNGFVDLKLNGKTVPVDTKSSPIGYRIDSKGLKPLEKDEMPNCT